MNHKKSYRKLFHSDNDHTDPKVMGQKKKRFRNTFFRRIRWSEYGVFAIKEFLHVDFRGNEVSDGNRSHFHRLFLLNIGPFHGSFRGDQEISWKMCLMYKEGCCGEEEMAGRREIRHCSYLGLHQHVSCLCARDRLPIDPYDRMLLCCGVLLVLLLSLLL